MNEEKFRKILKGTRIRIADDGEYRIGDKQIDAIVHDIFIEEGEQ